MPEEARRVASRTIDNNRGGGERSGGGNVSGEAEKRSDEEYEVWRARAGERIKGGGVEIQAA